MMARLAALIMPDEMETLALVYFGSSPSTLDNIKADNLDNETARNRNILERWRRQTKGEHQRQVRVVIF